MSEQRHVTHRLKIDEHWWTEIANGRKTSELRLDDRDYQIGDTVTFTSASGYCGSRTITHVLKNVTGLATGYVVLSLNNPEFDWACRTAERRLEWAQAAERRIAALKGVITKQRKQIATLKGGRA